MCLLEINLMVEIQSVPAVESTLRRSISKAGDIYTAAVRGHSLPHRQKGEEEHAGTLDTFQNVPFVQAWCCEWREQENDKVNKNSESHSRSM